MKRSFILLALLLVGLMFFVGCTEENGHDEDITFEVIDRSENEVAAYVCGDHWHGELPEVLEGEHISLGAYILDNEKEIELDNEDYALGVDHAPGADEDVVGFDLYGDHIHIVGETEGKTEVVFQLIHNDHIDYETPAIEVKVTHD